MLFTGNTKANVLLRRQENTGCPDERYPKLKKIYL
jgi:hypothetical protein